MKSSPETTPTKPVIIIAEGVTTPNSPPPSSSPIEEKRPLIEEPIAEVVDEHTGDEECTQLTNIAPNWLQSNRLVYVIGGSLLFAGIVYFGCSKVKRTTTTHSPCSTSFQRRIV